MKSFFELLLIIVHAFEEYNIQSKAPMRKVQYNAQHPIALQISMTISPHICATFWQRCRPVVRSLSMPMSEPWCPSWPDPPTLRSTTRPAPIGCPMRSWSAVWMRNTDGGWPSRMERSRSAVSRRRASNSQCYCGGLSSCLLLIHIFAHDWCVTMYSKAQTSELET